MQQITKCLTKNSKEIIYNTNCINYLIIHHTASQKGTTLYNILKFFKRIDYLSVHYVIGKGGEIVQYVDDKDVAFHAGVSEWKDLTNLNYYSIGIEVLSDGYEYTDEQRQSVVDLSRYLMKKYEIPSKNVLRHADIAPKRKWDIGPNFFAKWGSWIGFQEHLAGTNLYQDEIEQSTKFVIDNELSNGERPDDNVSRKEQWVMMKRLYNKIKGE